MPASENRNPTPRRPGDHAFGVGDHVIVVERQPDRVRSCWQASANLTEVLLDPDWTSPPPPSASLPSGQRLTIAAALGSPVWTPLDSPGPWFLAEFVVAQTTWQTAVTGTDVRLISS